MRVNDLDGVNPSVIGDGWITLEKRGYFLEHAVEIAGNPVLGHGDAAPLFHRGRDRVIELGAHRLSP